MKKELLILGILLAEFIFWGGCIVGKKINKSPNVEINNYSQCEPLSDWEIMKLAIAKTESEFNPLAVGKKEDFGLYQITPIYVKEVNRILGEERYTHDEAFSIRKSNEMFEIMQGRHNPTRDIDKAISSHNPTATSAYLIKVRKNMEWVRKYEEMEKTRACDPSRPIGIDPLARNSANPSA